MDEMCGRNACGGIGLVGFLGIAVLVRALWLTYKERLAIREKTRKQAARDDAVSAALFARRIAMLMGNAQFWSDFSNKPSEFQRAYVREIEPLCMELDEIQRWYHFIEKLEEGPRRTLEPKTESKRQRELQIYKTIFEPVWRTA